MRTPTLTVLLFILMLSSCRDSNTTENNSNKDSISEKELNIEDKDDSNTYTKGTSSSNKVSDSNIDPTTSNTNTNTEKQNQEIQASSLSGNFIKISEEMDDSCACYCVDINYSGNSELCLAPSKIFINIRMAKSNNQTTNIFFVKPSPENTGGKDIPWSKFDTNTPIATITSNGNGEMELDWLGFSINGDLAIDYAILGKKTLEGNYKKK